MRKRKIKQISLGILTSLIVSIPIFISSNTYATGPLQPGTDPAVIFAASCATCHGAKGTGGVTWIKMNPADKRIAPPLVNLSASSIYNRVREGAPSNGMPAFGKEIITDSELNALANFIANSPQSGVAPPAAPGLPADEVRLDILDADPWYTDRGADNALDPFGGPSTGDIKRVALGAGEYLKIYNTGRTWHTFTRPKKTGETIGVDSKDSGFIGYAGNYDTTPGDLGDMGYYYADQTNGLRTGCNRYLCRMHPYMQVEVCTAGSLPQQTNEYAAVLSGGAIGLTRAHKHPISTPSVPGIGEVWVTVQSQAELGEDTYNQVNNSVSDFDGTYQVIADVAGTMTAVLPAGLRNVGNNPHNSYPGRSSAGPVVLSADWHDNTVVLMDATSKTIIGKNRSGGTNAHIFSLPDDNATNKDRFFVTHMGGNAIQEIDVDNGISNSGLRISGNTGPHGLWTCDDGQHILTADTFGGSATLYNVSGLYGGGTSTSASSGGASPLAPSIMSGFNGGCSRGFTNNALTADVSIYDITLGDPDAGTKDAVAHNDGWTAIGTGTKNAANNIALKDTVNNQTGLGLGSFVARWANLPIQTPVSPGNATTHGQFMVTANKASFNVSITGLRASDGLPWGLFTIPAGLGAHGVTYGQKASCDANDNGIIDPSEVGNGSTTEKCYYAYVSNTFEDYVSVYDLDAIDVDDQEDDDNPEIIGDAVGDDVQPCGALEDCVGMDIVGSAIVAERVYVEGGAVSAVAALDPIVAGLCDVVDVVGGVPVYDLPPSLCTALSLPAINCSADPGGDGEAGFVGATKYNLNLADGNGDVLHCGVGAMDTVSVNLIAAGAVVDGTPVPLAAGQSHYVADLPIGVLCPNCRAGVHAGDVNLVLDATVEGATLAGAPTGVLSITLGTDPTGAASKYTYVKDEVYVDTETTACALQLLSGLPVGAINNCNASTILRNYECGTDIVNNDSSDDAVVNDGCPANGAAEVGAACLNAVDDDLDLDVNDGCPVVGSVSENDAAGVINAELIMDLELGINTGGQGISGVPAAFPFP